MADLETVHDTLDHTGLTGVGGGKVLQVVTAVSTATDSTSLDTLQNSSLSLAITPVAATSTLLIEVDGTCLAGRAAGTHADRIMWVAIRNSTNSVTLVEQERGQTLSATSASTLPIYMPIGLKAKYTVDSTAARTFVLQYRANLATNGLGSIRGEMTGGVMMTIMEIAA